MKRVVILFWFTIVLGFVVSPVAIIGVTAAKGTPFTSAASEWFGNLFRLGFNEFLIALIGGLPFSGAAVFSLFHLSAEQAPRGRWAGIAGALGAGIAMSLWIHISILTSRSSTAGIGFLLLPFAILFVMPIGYLAGRLIAKPRAT
jgi:hypothetical protein